MAMALIVAQRSTCVRRAVGCVMINDRGHVLATGYNGVATGLVHCTEARCPGADLVSGTGLSACEAVHAEVNAIIQCKNVFEIDTLYSTTSMCVNCAKLVMSTSCKRIVFLHKYTQEGADNLLEQRGIQQVEFKDFDGLGKLFNNATNGITNPKRVAN